VASRFQATYKLSVKPCFISLLKDINILHSCIPSLHRFQYIRNIHSDLKIIGRLKHKMQTFSKDDYDYDAREPRLLKRRASISVVFGCDSNPLIPNVFFILISSFEYYSLFKFQLETTTG
jgi:hypothetical protein